MEKDFSRLIDVRLITSVYFLCLATSVHAQVYKWDNPKAKSHGKEWKYRFNNLLLPFINAKIFNQEVSQALNNQLHSLKATCGANPDLLKALKPEIKSNLIFL